MPRIYKTSLAVIGLTALAMVAAAPFTVPQATAAEEEKKKVDPLQIARGAKAWAYTCNRCHNLRLPAELSDGDWEVSVNHMRIRANLPGQVARDIAAFLKASN